MTVMTLEDWRDQGRTRTQLAAALRESRVVRLRRGVVAEFEEASRTAVHRMKIEAAAPFLGPGTYFAHESAAVLHGLPLLSSRLDEVVVVRTKGGHGTITKTLHARRAQLSVGDAAEVDGFPVTSLIRTTCDLARRLPFPEAVMVADAALRSPLDRGELLRRIVGGRGCRMAAAAVEFADARSESPGESLSRVRIHRAGLPAPTPQVELVDDFGQLVARVDFWWEGEGVVGEFDGMVKYVKLLRPGQSTEDVISAEKSREQALVAAGCRVVRWTWRDLWNGELEHRLRQALDRSGATPTSRASLGVHSLLPRGGPRR
ncbi:MAG TPA: hypothetical protein VGK18_13345 [Propionicimonas sp.]|jgi:hypothetical protein|uniref:hypothetical protein n=1 Tax=Propionicimonas sp. TaxID=1955623 RepID=UPI002F419F7A